MPTAQERNKSGSAVCRKYDLTPAQMDVLRQAARKLHYQHGTTPESQKPHDGSVNTYGVMDKTLRVLLERNLIAKDYKINNKDARHRIKTEAEALIEKAFRDAADGGPFEMLDEPDPILRWEDVRIGLQVAKGKYSELANTTLRITMTGRLVAGEWKKAIGAEEE